MLAFSRVSTVEVSSVKLPISFNMKAIAEFEKETGSQLFDLLNRLGKSAFDSSIIPLIWAALEDVIGLITKKWISLGKMWKLWI